MRLRLLTIMLLISGSLLAQWGPPYYHSSNVFSKTTQNYRSDMVFAGGDFMDVHVARMVEYTKQISLNYYGSWEIGDMEGLNTFLTLENSVHIVNMVVSEQGELLLALRHTDSLVVADSLLSITTPYTPKDVLVSYNLFADSIIFVRPAEQIADICAVQNWPKSTWYILTHTFSGNNILKLSPDGNFRDTLVMENVLSNSLVSDPQNPATLYIGALFNGYDTIKVGNYSKYLPHSSAVGAVSLDTNGNGNWIQWAEDLTYSFPHIHVSQNYTVMLTGDLFGSQVWGSDTLEGSQWVYDFFLTTFDQSGQVLSALETPNTATITGDYRLAKRQPLINTGFDAVLMLSHRGTVALDGQSYPLGGVPNPQTHGVTFAMTDGYSFYSTESFNLPGGAVEAHGHIGMYNQLGIWGAGLTYGDSLLVNSDTLFLDSTYSDIIGRNLYWEWSIPEEDRPSAQLYPNPIAHGALQCSKRWDAAERITVVNALGQQMFEGEAVGYRVDYLPSGTYIVYREDGTHLRFVKL